MNFIETPNLPKGPVGLVILDGRIDEKIEQSLAKRNIKVLKTCAHADVYEAIAYHPDIVLHHLGEEYIVYAPGTSEHLLKMLKNLSFVLLEGEKHLGPKYPANIAYNVARVGKLAFHNFKYSDPILKQELVRRGVKLVNVNQGYSKCSISIVDEKSIITADRGIAKAAIDNGIETLVIDSDENISLPGLSYGLIGGSTGLLDKSKWAVSGDFWTLASAYKISHFLNERGIELISLSDEQIIDIGSIISLL